MANTDWMREQLAKVNNGNMIRSIVHDARLRAAHKNFIPDERPLWYGPCGTWDENIYSMKAFDACIGCSICKPDAEEVEQRSKERLYGFTLTIPVEKKESAKSILEASLHKIRNSKAFKISKWYGCFELTKNDVYHAHVIMAVDKSEGKYPRKDNIAKMHPYGLDWIIKPKKSWLAWHRYIAGAGKEKFGFFGSPFLADKEALEGAPFGQQASPADAP